MQLASDDGLPEKAGNDCHDGSYVLCYFISLQKSIGHVQVKTK